jgi:hypothetical protein
MITSYKAGLEEEVDAAEAQGKHDSKRRCANWI